MSVVIIGGNSGGGGGGSVAWGDVTGKPVTFPPTTPIAQADVTDLTTDLAAKSSTAHTHNASAITAGTLPVERGGTGVTAIGTAAQVLRVNAGGTALEFATLSGASLADGDYGDVTVSASGTVISIDNSAVSDAKLRNSAGLSVIGRSASTTGAVADITAANDGEVLRRSGTALGFGTVATAGIADNAVNFAKLQNLSGAGVLVGRYLSGLGDAAEITLGTGLSMSGAGVLAVTNGLTDGDKGDVTVSSSGTVWTVDNGTISNAKLASMSQATFKGRASGAGTGAPTDLSSAEALTILGITTDGAATASDVNTGTSTTLAVTPDALAGSNIGTKSVGLLVVPMDTAITTGDGKVYCPIPAPLNGMNLISLSAYHPNPSGASGATQIMVARIRAGVAADMLSATLQVDFNERDSSTALNGYTINAANDDVLTHDVVRIDIDGIPGGTAPSGLLVTLNFQLP